MALKTPKRTFSNVKKSCSYFCLISQEESNLQNVFVTLQWKISAQGTQLLFDKRHKVAIQSLGIYSYASLLDRELFGF